ncbi:MAG: RIP metalloprotease RseP [Polaribacter sp.]|jgi:regulator of sigma E protease|nr:RIP metalloprotease RseP [Polaribacter sp.]
MDILIKASQLILSLSILVVLHELGHFIPAKLFKTRVEKFYLFFDPWFSLVKRRVGGTEYGIGWLPLGGYVKISGMIDESMDKEQMKKPAEDWEFRAKPAWQRLIIMLGGVTVNLLLGIFIYSMILFVWGDKYVSNESLENGVICSDFAKEYGFKDGDKLVSIDGEKVDVFYDIVGEDYKPTYLEMMIYNDDKYVVVVDRGGIEVSVPIGANFIKYFKEDIKKQKESGDEVIQFFEPRKGDRLQISGFSKNSNAENSGLKKGDELISVNGVKTFFLTEFKNELQKPDNIGGVVNIEYNRDGKLDVIPVIVSKDATIGISVSDLVISIDTFNFISSFAAGYNLTKKELGGYIKGVGMIFNSDNSLGGDVGGFGAIGSMFPSSWNWEKFWYLTAFLSLILAFMNLLPIPALDGGHVMFLLYEIIAGKPAPEKFMERAQMVGMILLLGLLVFANGQDIYKLF